MDTCDQLEATFFDFNKKYFESFYPGYLDKMIGIYDSIQIQCKPIKPSTCYSYSMALIRRRNFNKASEAIEQRDSLYLYPKQKAVMLSLLTYTEHLFVDEEYEALNLVDSISDAMEREIIPICGAGNIHFAINDFIFLNINLKGSLWIEKKIEEFAQDFPSMSGSILAMKDLISTYEKESNYLYN